MVRNNYMESLGAGAETNIFVDLSSDYINVYIISLNCAFKFCALFNMFYFTMKEFTRLNGIAYIMPRHSVKVTPTNISNILSLV